METRFANKGDLENMLVQFCVGVFDQFVII